MGAPARRGRVPATSRRSRGLTAPARSRRARVPAAPDDLPAIPVCAPGADCAWRSLGGTSAAAPLVAAGLALAEEARVAQGSPPVALWNPVLYGPDRNSFVLVDVVDGSNDLFDVGCCDAGEGYDEASGLGTLDLARLGGLTP
ncbi:MAG: hypothetical protein U5R31_15000 [Acidimicrobiia bacterium]|nr:hypothetical protein [Acidimicrobiia bacterium]